MKSNFKPLGIAAAVAAATAGYSNVASAQPAVANNALGDLALVPYYTVADDWITGIHIVNTSDKTQVVKFRFRRAGDSMDALDFNIVMSPYDVYAGFLSDDENGAISWAADDTTCTVPATSGGKLTMPEIFREGAETGYVEIIAMGQTVSETQPIAITAKHSGAGSDPALTPLSCQMVRGNFFADGTPTRQGVADFETTWATDILDLDDDDSTSDELPSFYEDSDDVLKVSYFIRDNASGVEFGDNAVHIQGFLEEAAITNQQFGYLSGDLDGFDFPDLDGGSPVDGVRGRFDELRDGGVLGVSALINEWTANEANGAALDWVVTLPGQYVMLHRPGYIASLGLDSLACVKDSVIGALDPNTQGADILAGLTGWSAGDPPVPVICDFRDLPVVADISAWNREEFEGEDPDENLVVSPSPPGSVPQVILNKEVNVITFGGNSVLGTSDTDISADLAQPYGWLSLAVSAGGELCNWNPATDTGVGAGAAPDGSPRALDPDEILAQMSCSSAFTNDNTPIIGFAAWERNVAANPDASYGRIVAHSFVSGS
ncbi:hypothetical protein [Pseudohaliea sp.]|uniref:hypothetical protein n=1 Tax=Pseudohaliea sp. TaxID=2740289 RepID=UPI0032EF9C42